MDPCFTPWITNQMLDVQMQAHSHFLSNLSRQEGFSIDLFKRRKIKNGSICFERSEEKKKKSIFAHEIQITRLFSLDKSEKKSFSLFLSLGYSLKTRRYFFKCQFETAKRLKTNVTLFPMAQLQVTLVEAKNLKQKDTLSANDAYVQIYFDDKKQKQKSKVKQNSNNPGWHQSFILSEKFFFH